MSEKRKRVKSVSSKVIIDDVCHKTGFRYQDVKLVYRKTFETILEHLIKGERVAIAFFGRFDLVQKPPRVVVNPKTQEKQMSKYKGNIKFATARPLVKYLSIVTDPEYDGATVKQDIIPDDYEE